MKAGLIENLFWFRSEGTVHLIALERDPYAIIMSFRSRLDFLNKGNVWLWYLDPEYPRNLVPSPDLLAAGINGFCLWYFLEIRARAACYEERLAGQHDILVHHFGLEELRSAEGVSRLLRALGILKPPAEVRIPSPKQREPAANQDRPRGRSNYQETNRLGAVRFALRRRVRPRREECALPPHLHFALPK
jgi:hypothetical protein